MKQSGRLFNLMQKSKYCYWCGIECERSKPSTYNKNAATVDHLYPAGVDYTAKHNEETTVLACVECNALRGAISGRKLLASRYRNWSSKYGRHRCFWCDGPGKKQPSHYKAMLHLRQEPLCPLFNKRQAQRKCLTNKITYVSAMITKTKKHLGQVLWWLTFQNAFALGGVLTAAGSIEPADNLWHIFIFLHALGTIIGLHVLLAYFAKSLKRNDSDV